MFSLDKEADELIKQLVENSASPRNMIVVSDDKEIRLASSFSRARVSGVEEFICGKKNLRTASAKVAETDFKLSFASIEKINSELRKKWLKE
jgi:maltodextrin utilization protein YvdJ